MASCSIVAKNLSRVRASSHMFLLRALGLPASDLWRTSPISYRVGGLLAGPPMDVLYSAWTGGLCWQPYIFVREFVAEPQAFRTPVVRSLHYKYDGLFIQFPMFELAGNAEQSLLRISSLDDMFEDAVAASISTEVLEVLMSRRISDVG